MLTQAGFTFKPAKGSHTKWTHTKLTKTIIISGKDGSDAKPYLEKQVQQSLQALKQINNQENN